MADSSKKLLSAAYSRLGYSEGDLVDVSDRPTKKGGSLWTDKGDWLALALKVGAEKVFFVNNYPVAIFADAEDAGPQAWTKFFNSVWCMARPQLLFLARTGELSVFNLNVRPARTSDDADRELRLLDTVKATADVQSTLARYRREQIESGRLFEDERFGRGDRADKTLIRDLGKVRKALMDAGLTATLAHSLIGRSIFIRYLEDRGVLTGEYFLRIARKNSAWKSTLEEEELAGPETDSKKLHYPSVLRNKEFCYATFSQLCRDFNGDIFPVDDIERTSVTAQHLNLLRQFLLGRMENSLFFFAYRFDVIPIELISSIYESFYTTKPGQQRSDGCYYTDAALVDFVLANTLDRSCLKKRPRVIDPACGSGIFLVETFRRMVRNRMAKLRRRLRPNELRAILRDQIAGIDINPEAIRVAAFSLYLAMLHYLEPPDILQHRLPSLTYTKRERTDPQEHFDILIATDAFGIDRAIADPKVQARFLSSCADVVVGNPPWGAPSEDEDLSASDGGIAWCASRGLDVGDRERSQSFIHRTLDMLKKGGVAGLLVSTGVFFKRHPKSQSFRKHWFGAATLRKVFNFAAVRDAFFRLDVSDSDSKGGGTGAVAPFAAVVFDKKKPNEQSSFEYWCAKETAFVKRVKAVVMNRADFCHAWQSAFSRDDSLWKIYWWGNHRDHELISRLRQETTLSDLFDPDNQLLQSGYKKGAGKAVRYDSGWLSEFVELPAKLFVRYGDLPTDGFETPPTRVERRRERMLYEGQRLLIKRGINTDEVSQGRITARFETVPFCYRHSIYSLPIQERSADEALVALGIIWSSLTRYFLFLTSGTWGLWHDELLKETLVNLPMRLPPNSVIAKRIIGPVERLRNLPKEVTEPSLFPEFGMTLAQRKNVVNQLEAELDEAVFELFELTDAERERVVEVCGTGLDLFYNGMKSSWVDPIDCPDHSERCGYAGDLQQEPWRSSELGWYLSTFVGTWEPHLKEQNGRLRWRVVAAPAVSSMLAVVFQAEEIGKPLNCPEPRDQDEWNSLVLRISEDSRQIVDTSRIFIDGLVRVVTDSDIVLMKRNERRLWTSSAARDDAEATMLIAMQSSLVIQCKGGKGQED